MEATSEILESVGLTSKKKAPRKRKPARPKSAVEKLIPSKKGKGHRTAAAKQCIAWIVAAAESFPSREGEEIPPVICLPCLEIKFEKQVEQATPTREVMTSAFTRPPTSALATKFPEKIMGVTSSPSASPPQKTVVGTPVLNGVAHGAIVPQALAIQDGFNLDKDLVAWMKAAFSRYIILAGQRPNCGRTWGLRMAQIACGFDVMALGTERTKEVFPYFVGALFELVDAAKSIKDLDLLEFILKDVVYLDVLAEVAEFHTKNGLVSTNFQNHHDDRYLAFDAANDLLGKRAKS
jgi:hypothetical protein